MKNGVTIIKVSSPCSHSIIKIRDIGHGQLMPVCSYCGMHGAQPTFLKVSPESLAKKMWEHGQADLESMPGLNALKAMSTAQMTALSASELMILIKTHQCRMTSGEDTVNIV